MLNGTKASWRGTKANISFEVEAPRQLNFYQVFMVAIYGFANEGLLAIKRNTHPPNRPIILLYDNFTVTGAESHHFSIALVTQ